MSEPRVVSPLDTVRQSQGKPILIDWFGVAPGAPLSFLYASSGTEFVFGLSSSVQLNGLGKFGEFTEGLWKADVVELFLHDQASESYLELNLSPTGAWWAKKFSSYREGGVDQPALDIEVVKGPSMLLRYRMDAPMDLLVAQTAIVYLAGPHYLIDKYCEFEKAEVRCGSTPDFHLRSLATRRIF